MALLRILQTSQVTLSHTFAVDEVPTDAAGDVTVTVKRLDGSAVASGTATHGATGTYTWPVTRAVLDTLTVDWTGTVGGSVVTARDVVEVVGGFLFDLADARAELKLSPTVWPSVKLAAKRLEVEVECESICGVAFVPRFKRVAVNGTGTGLLPMPDLMVRAVRSVTVGSTAWTVDQVAAVTAGEAGVLHAGYWPPGFRNVVVEYEYGLDYPPEHVRSASVLRLRSILPRTGSGVPERAVSFTDPTGGVYRLSTPSAKATGIPDVDAAYSRERLEVGFA